MWATAGPRTFDCSGFTWWVGSQVLGPLDSELRSSHHQFNVWGEPIFRREEHRPGDLVFFDTTGVEVFGNRASHVGMMIDGERFIHAANADLGVRIDALDAAWYAPKFIGVRRIFDLGDPSLIETLPPAPHKAPRRRVTLPRTAIDRKVLTRNPWNGGEFGASWDDVYQWHRELEAAAREFAVDARYLAVLMMIESQGIHERDGAVLEVWDDYPQDGPSVGIMQVKPWLWQELVPGADPWVAADNIRLGAAVLADLIGTHGDFFAAIANGYHPAAAPHGTTPNSYVESAMGLLKELGYG